MSLHYQDATLNAIYHCNVRHAHMLMQIYGVYTWMFVVSITADTSEVGQRVIRSQLHQD